MSKKRARVVSAKPGELKAAWGSDGDRNVDLVYAWGDGINKADSWLLYALMSVERYDSIGNCLPSFKEELIARGYDITSLKFTISKLESVDDIARRS